MEKSGSGTGIGARLVRKEDARLLLGRGNYVGDIKMPGLKEVAFLRSPIAHGRIRSIDIPTSCATAVLRVEDLADLKPIRALSGIPGFKPSDYPALASGKVRYVGEAVVMCVAKTRALAEDLTQQVKVEFEELPPLVDT